MKIGLIDVDGHNFPNMALMKISSFHKNNNDLVEWWLGPLFHYDMVYKAKVFSNSYSIDKFPDNYINSDIIIKGGTGYDINLVNGIEIFNKSNDLPSYIENQKPDYSIYPEFNYCVSITSRGCPRNCPFCHVTKKEGNISYKVADVEQYYNGQKLIKILDPNITACKEKRDLFKQYIDTKAFIDFTQGLDIRLINDYDIDDLNKMKIKFLHFAWDNPKIDLSKKFKDFYNSFYRKGIKKIVYVLVNFNSTLEEDLFRIYTLRDIGYDPFVMIYNKPYCNKTYKRLQRWCNNKRIFKTVYSFYDYI